MSRIFAVAFATILFAASSASAATHDRCVTGATIYSATEAPRAATVCIAGGRISGIFDAAAAAPDAGETIDAKGSWLTAGLTDVGTQVGLIDIEQEHDANDTEGGGDPVRAGLRADYDYNPDSAVIAVCRSGGLTSVVSGHSGGLISGVAEWFDLGRGSSAELLPAQRGLLRASYGSGAGHTVGGSRGDAMLRYRELLDDVRSYAGNRTDYLQNRMRELTLSRTDLDAMIPFAVTGGTWVVDVHRQSDIEALLRLAAEKRLTFAFTGAEEAWKVAPALAAAGSFVIVQSFSNLPGSFDELGSREDNAALLDKAGVKVILTTAETHNARNLRYVAGNAVRAGMPWQRALASVTLHPAMLAGLDKDYGDVTVGRVANLVVWSGDPFETSTIVQQLLVRGERLPTTSRQHDLLRRYRSMDAYQRP